ncbi:STOREKEEPER protein-like isoform X2 [Ipomoea triloba]|uniref:STOREKEEPER protein-like isoform X2 n=1 Tax=Ipomoea triloba TaxID=35885 RepID=UPI00125D300E|nr:STOREKEEPER protein-like isoform X2 [Ipomoea triloba]
MAPKSKIRLVDQPPSASSTDEDEEQSEREELSDLEVNKSEAEYESESEEEEERAPSTPILNQDHSVSECDESHATLPSPSASDFTIKPILSSKLPPVSPPKPPAPSKSSAKRAAEAIEKDSKKKRSKTGEGDANAEEKKSATSAGSNRLWSDEDQLAILQGMVDYQAQKGAYPDMSELHDFIKDKLHIEVSKIQMSEKLRRLKKKFFTLSEKGDELDFTKPHDSMSFELSKQIWGTASGSVNGKNLNAISNNVELNVKTANGKVKKPAEVRKISEKTVEAKKISEKPVEVKKISEKPVEVKKISESRNSVKVDNYMNIPNEEESEKKRKKTAAKAEDIEKKKKKKQRIAFEEKEERVEQNALEEKDDPTVVEETDKQIALDESDKHIAIDERDKQIALEDKNKQVIKDIVNGEVETEEGDFNSKYPHLANSFIEKNYSWGSHETLNMLKKKLNLIGSSKAEEIEEKWTKLLEEQAELCVKIEGLLSQQMGLVLEAIRQKRGNL